MKLTLAKQKKILFQTCDKYVFRSSWVWCEY